MKTRTIESLADWFWSEASLPPTFPRDIERAVALALPVTVISLPRLASETIDDWLRRREISIAVPPGQKDLMGCVIARSGHAFILVCGSDPEDERRFSIAHEVAHLLLHYLIPRQEVISALGAAALEVLDGHRLPTPSERATAILASVRVGPHVHLLPRRGRGAQRVAGLEDEADLLALELLAPRSVLLNSLRSSDIRPLSIEQRCEILATRFGIPAVVLREALGIGRPGRPPSFVDETRAILKTRLG